MTEAAVETYDTTTRGAASMAAYRAVRILQLLSENTGEDKAMLSDELIRRRSHPDDPARMPISAARRSIYTAMLLRIAIGVERLRMTIPWSRMISSSVSGRVRSL